MYYNLLSSGYSYFVAVY